jgi:hypothetical protein
VFIDYTGATGLHYYPGSGNLVLILGVGDIHSPFVAWQYVRSGCGEEVGTYCVDPCILVCWNPIFKVVVDVKACVIYWSLEWISIGLKILDSAWIDDLDSWCVVELSSIMTLKVVEVIIHCLVWSD